MKKSNQIKKIFISALIMFLGLILLKFIPMNVFGKNILFDASLHIVIACFVLYILYFFIDQNKSWKIPYFIFCFLILAIVSIQRIIVNAHNDIGLLIGLLISMIAIGIANYKQLKKKIKF